MKTTLTAFFLLVSVRIAAACPVCDTETGAAVREGIFNESFLRTLVEVASPFPLFAMAFLALNRFLPN